MRKLSVVFTLFSWALTLASQTASAGAGGSGTLAAYTASGFSCTIDDKSFSGFSYFSSATGGATQIAASGVSVTPEVLVVNGVTEIGFLFSAPWTATSGQGTDSLIGYTVTSLGTPIVDTILQMDGAGFTGTGIADVAENLTNRVNLFVFTDTQGTVLTQTATFAGVQSVTIDFKDVLASGGTSGTAAVSGVFNLFSQSPVPEPGSMRLMGTALVPFVGMLRRRKSEKSVVA